MKKRTRLKLAAAYQYCREQAKSTDSTLAYLQDVAGVDRDAVTKYLAQWQGWEKK